jgi:nucleoside-diphosphate-sugar epimerase
MVHKKDVPKNLRERENVRVFRADLEKPETIAPPLEGVACVVHFAGILFKARPEKFLPKTNTIYFKNLLDEAVKAKVKRVILISFPHVEGEATPQNPARGSLDGAPESMHAKTRLEEEKLLFEYAKKFGFEGVSLRVGMVYGRGILMIDAAREFAKRHILGIWKKPNFIHLISIPDFLDATYAAATKPNITGIYHIGDEGVQTLKEFLDAACRHWQVSRPKTMPLWMIYAAAAFFELYSSMSGGHAYLTRDFITIGRASYYDDTSRMRAELLPELKYKTFRDGINTL